MDKIFEIHERANEAMFNKLWPELKAEHQFDGQYGLDFQFNYDVYHYVGDYKFNTHKIDAYDDKRGLLLEPTKLDKTREWTNSIGIYIRFCTDGVAIMNLNEFDPEEYSHYWGESWVEKTQIDSTRQKEKGWFIPSTDPIWNIQYYSDEQKQYHSKLLKWKEEQIRKVNHQNVLDVFNTTFGNTK